MSNFTEAWLPGPKLTSFYTRTYHPESGSPRGVVVFIHGFIEHVARYEHVHKRWADRGFVVFTFDQRGFGRTALDAKKSPSAVYGRTGDTDQIPDIAWALSVAQEANPTVPLFLMGHSMVRYSIFSSFATSSKFVYKLWPMRIRGADWSCRSRRVPIPRIASLSYQASLPQVLASASPSRQPASHAGSAPACVPSFRIRTSPQASKPRYVIPHT
jgi:predicted alpha/beta hydrolase